MSVSVIPESTTAAPKDAFSPRLRVLVLLTGLLLPQLALHGSALTGRTVPYPCDLLLGVYLPASEYPDVVVQDQVLYDLVLELPMHREFLAAEYHAGRVPLWNPYVFLGAPAATFSKYSPFELLYFLVPSNRTIAALFIAQALVAGSGAYVVFRRICGCSFWASAICAWAWPLTGFFVLWHGFQITQAVAWLPWVLVATNWAIRQPWGWSGPVLAITTMTCVYSRFDTSGHVLLFAGLYALFTWGRLLWRDRFSRRTWLNGMTPAAAWALGLVLCFPFILPLLEYTRTGSRIQDRAAGVEERPPVGIAALPLVCVPDFYGTSKRDSYSLGKPDLAYLLGQPGGKLSYGNQLESAAAGYAGTIALLCLAPLAFGLQQRRPLVLFWSAIVVLGLAWQLNVPGLVDLLRLNGLNLLPHNRFVFASGFATLCLASMGWDSLQDGSLEKRRWLLIPLGLAALLGLICLSRGVSPPEPLARQLTLQADLGRLNGMSVDDVARIRQTFTASAFWACVRCLAAATALVCVWVGFQRAVLLRITIAVVLFLELFPFAWRDRRHSEAALYYPRIPALEALAKLPPGRIIGEIQPNLGMTHDLRDVRGYDAVDPVSVLKLLDLGRDPRFESPSYARTQALFPMLYEDPESKSIRFSPVYDMLNVRYLILRMQPIDVLKTVAHSPEYWVVENPRALPRAWVAETVIVEPSSAKTLERLGQPTFDGRKQAYVERPLNVASQTTGEVEIVDENPQWFKMKARMRTSGLVVQSELWDPGWHVRVDGRPAEVVRVNTALRGVVVPAGDHVIEAAYWPASLATGLKLAGLAAAILAVWSGVFLMRARRYGS